MKSKSEKTHKLRKTEHTWLKFSFPAIFFVTLFMLYPIVYSLFLSLFKHKGLKATFVGLNNYIELFQDSDIEELKIDKEYNATMDAIDPAIFSANHWGTPFCS